MYGPVEERIVPGKDVYGYTEITEVPAPELKASDPDEREAF